MFIPHLIYPRKVRRHQALAVRGVTHAPIAVSAVSPAPNAAPKVSPVPHTPVAAPDVPRAPNAAPEVPSHTQSTLVKFVGGGKFVAQQLKF